MAAIADTLAQAGFGVFLPHRDGFLFADLHRELVRGGYEAHEAAGLLQRAIFGLDCYQVLVGCQGLVLNLNGRVPDEGAVAEAAMAWTAGRPIVLYKDDSRSLIQGQDNPLVSGLGGFVRVSTLPEIACAFTQLFKRRAAAPPRLSARPRAVLEHGQRLSRALACFRSAAERAGVVVRLARAPQGRGQG